MKDNCGFQNLTPKARKLLAVAGVVTGVLGGITVIFEKPILKAVKDFLAFAKRAPTHLFVYFNLFVNFDVSVDCR